MVTEENIKEFLPERLWGIAPNFDIPADMLEFNSDLVVLVLESKSISEQKEKLAEIEAKYQAKQDEIRKKYEETYASGAYQQQQDKIRDTESASRQQEEVEADALLDQI